MTAQRRRFGDLPLSQQAGILCNDPRFQKFVARRLALPGAGTASQSQAAEYIRQVCRVHSRAHLDNRPEAQEKFAALRAHFDEWAGRFKSPL